MPLMCRRAVPVAALAAALGLAGCGPQSRPDHPDDPDPPAAEERPVAVIPVVPTPPAPEGATPRPSAAPAAPEVVAKAPQPPAEPPTQAFEFPTDLVGKALPRAVAPPALPPLPTGRVVGNGPLPRAVPATVTAPEPFVRTPHIPAPVLPKKVADLRPVPPTERVPLALGLGAETVPEKPALPDAPGLTIPAPDVDTPPALPMLSRPYPDRASLDDPSAEAGNAVIANHSLIPQLTVAGFLKVSLPDPFELAAQVAPKVPPSAEPAASPVPVNPERPK